MGGTLFEGMTCSALTAGVMALGLVFGEIEDSRPRVARMLATMALRRDALADDINAFNRAMNLGHDLAAWFETQFGSTQCRALTGCDFATADGVHAYIEHDGTTACARIARLVAERVAEMIAAVPADVPADGSASRDTASGTYDVGDQLRRVNDHVEPGWSVGVSEAASAGALTRSSITCQTSLSSWFSFQMPYAVPSSTGGTTASPIAPLIAASIHS